MVTERGDAVRRGDGRREPHAVRRRQRLPNATLHVFSRVSHGVPREAREEFTNVLADFLEHGVVTAQTLQAKLQTASRA